MQEKKDVIVGVILVILGILLVGRVVSLGCIVGLTLIVIGILELMKK